MTLSKLRFRIVINLFIKLSVKHFDQIVFAINSNNFSIVIHSRLLSVESNVRASRPRLECIKKLTAHIHPENNSHTSGLAKQSYQRLHYQQKLYYMPFRVLLCLFCTLVQHIFAIQNKHNDSFEFVHLYVRVFSRKFSSIIFRTRQRFGILLKLFQELLLFSR